VSARRPGPVAPHAATPYLVAVVSGAMCFLAVLALEAAGGAARVSGAWSDGMAGAATVRIPAPEGRSAATPLAIAALAALSDAPGVADARLLAAEEMAALAAPWLGDALNPAEWPAPLLIDVTLADPPPARDAMQARLDAAAPGALYDDHAAWRAPLEQAAAAFRRLAFWSVGLMGIALAAMVTAAARASLAGAAATVRTLRLLGARDGDVARAFERPIALRALIGGALGAPAAALALSQAPLGLGPALGAPAPWSATLALIVAAPLASAALAWLTARLAILLMLRRAP